MRFDLLPRVRSPRRQVDRTVRQKDSGAPLERTRAASALSLRRCVLLAADRTRSLRRSYDSLACCVRGTCTKQAGARRSLERRAPASQRRTHGIFQLSIAQLTAAYSATSSDSASASAASASDSASSAASGSSVRKIMKFGASPIYTGSVSNVGVPSSATV